MTNKLSIFAAATLVVLSLVACQKAPEQAAVDTGDANTAKATDALYKACMVSDQGGFHDKSFNESGKNGLDKAQKELGIIALATESRGPEDFKKNIDSLVAQDCNMIIGVGFMLNDAIRNAAKSNPTINFGLIDSDFTDNQGKRIKLDNAKPLLFNTAEAAFLAGYLAAGMTKTGVVATYGGMSIPSVDIFRDGFSDGITQYNSDNTSAVRLLGWNKSSQKGSAVGSFDDTAKGKELTEQFLAQNADIILPVAGPVGEGTLAVVKAAGKGAVIWVDADGYESTHAGEVILSSVVKEISQAVFQTIKDAKEGAFSADPYIGTLANNGVNIAPFHTFEDKVPAKLKQDLQAYRAKIISGEFKVETPNQP